MVKTSKQTHGDGIMTSHGVPSSYVNLFAFTMNSHDAIAMC
jgi:hypothetical protein